LELIFDPESKKEVQGLNVKVTPPQRVDWHTKEMATKIQQTRSPAINKTLTYFGSENSWMKQVTVLTNLPVQSKNISSNSYVTKKDLFLYIACSQIQTKPEEASI
jgi:hypothetical protein